MHDGRTPLLALKKEWIWWLLDWCDTWPFEKKGECIHSTSRNSFSQEIKKCYSAQYFYSNTHNFKKGKQPWASVGKNERKPCSTTEWLTEVRARADRELAPKGDMKNDQRKWEWPLQYAQGTGAVFWFGLDKTKSLAWGTSWQCLCVRWVKATEWNENGGDPASADTPKERVNEVAFSTWLKNCDSTAAEAL